MKRVTLLCVGAMLLAIPANPQSDPASAIRARIAQLDRGEGRDVAEANAIVWTGAYARPTLGETAPDPKDFVAVPNRRNVHTTTKVERIVFSQDGTMAYEYSTYTLTFDADGGHQTRNGAALRVWRKTGNDWKIAADFQRPYGRVQAMP